MDADARTGDRRSGPLRLTRAPPSVRDIAASDPAAPTAALRRNECGKGRYT